MRKILLLAIFAVTLEASVAQTKNYRAKLEGQASMSTQSHVPFWIRSNQFGSVPLSGPSISVVGSGYRDYDTSKVRLIDWGAGFEGRANAGKGAEVILIESYGKVKLSIFEIKGGRMKETFGLTDTLLTTGNFAISGNALGIPKVQIAIPQFYAIPIFGKIFAIKGVFAHGWMGELPIKYKRVDHAYTFFHQKALYGRFGKPGWRFHLFAGFNDQAFFGNEAKIFESFVLTDWQKYRSVVLGQSWAASKVGNHLGNIDVALQYRLKNSLIYLYRQSFYEVGALGHLANIQDGIHGISIRNLSPASGSLRITKLMFEFIYSKNQAGERWSKPTPTGNENYYNHYLYASGWSYKGANLGNPFFTPAKNAREGQASNPGNYFINNRIKAYHLGGQLSLKEWDLLTKLSFSENYGTHNERKNFLKVNQFSGYLEASRTLNTHSNIGFVVAADKGKLLDNSLAVIIKASRTFK